MLSDPTATDGGAGRRHSSQRTLWHRPVALAAIMLTGAASVQAQTITTVPVSAPPAAAAMPVPVDGIWMLLALTSMLLAMGVWLIRSGRGKLLARSMYVLAASVCVAGLAGYNPPLSATQLLTLLTFTQSAGETLNIPVQATPANGVPTAFTPVQFTNASGNLLVHVLVAGIEATRVSHHRHQPSLALKRRNGLRTCEAVRQRNFHLHMLARAHRLLRLIGMHLRGRAEDHSIEFLDLQALLQIVGDVRNAVLVRHLLRLRQVAADERNHLHVLDVANAIEMLDAERACAGECHFDRHAQFSRIRCPTAVFDAGTWKKRWRTLGALPPATSAIAPRAISHITSSMPSEPASRT